MPGPLTLLSDERAACYLITAREYGPPDPDAQRLNVYAIAVTFRLNPATTYRRQKIGWPGLNGGVLTPQYDACAGVPNGKETTYIKSEVARAMQPRPPITGRFQVQVNGEWRLTAERVQRELFVGDVLLATWDKSCTYLDGDPLLPMIVKSPETGAYPKTYAEKLID